MLCVRRWGSMPKWLTSKEAAVWLGCSVASIKRWVETAELPHWRTLGGQLRFDPAELDAWVEERRERG